jgi:hypothetical protein
LHKSSKLKMLSRKLPICSRKMDNGTIIQI